MEQTYTKAIDLLYLAKQQGVDVALNEDQLQLKLPKNKSIDKNLLDDLKSNKQLIIDFLKNRQKINNHTYKISRFDRNAIQHFPLSFSQERLWFIDQMEGSVQYHIPAVLRLKGKLNYRALKFALQSIANRHEVLRSVIRGKEGIPYQYVMPKDSFQLSLIDGSKFTYDPKGLQRQIEMLIAEPFDLANDLMLRATLIVLNDQEHLLVVVVHHIASDGWSTSIIVKEVGELYLAFEENKQVQLPTLDIQYADFAFWQKNYIEGEVLNRMIEYWKNKLANVEPIQLPTDFNRPLLQSIKGAKAGFWLDNELLSSFQSLSQEEGTTLFMTLLAAFNVLLHKYTGQIDICVGSPIAGRSQQEVETLIGFFVNTLALRSEVRGDSRFTEFLHQVKNTTLEAYTHQELPFEKVVETSVKIRDMSRSPLFQVMFVLQNTPEIPELRFGEVLLSGEPITHNTSKFELSFNITQTINGLHGSVEYCTDLFKEETIYRMIGHFTELLRSIVKDPREKISNLTMITKKEEEQLLLFNETKQDYPKDKSIVTLFEEQVSISPDATALIFEKDHLTYRQLNEKANQLAHYLRSKGVNSKSLIPICIERSPEMIIGILGILKAGAAYVPIDLKYPRERIRFMLEDTAATIVLSSMASSPIVQGIGTLEVILLTGPLSVINGLEMNNLALTIGPEYLAYIMYTSGSTGKPKGVKVDHRNVVSLVRGIDSVSVNPEDIILANGSFSFDASTFEFWGILLNGGQLVLSPEDRLLNSELLKEDIKNRSVTKMFFTTSWLNQLVDTDITVFEELKTIVTGGEKVSEHHINRIKEVYPSIEIIHAYGPTENTTFSLTYRVCEKTINTSIPIGRPLNNRSVYVVDSSGQLVPIGVKGEIWVGGAGVARGYLNRKELTQKKFIRNPFSNELTSRVYKTGDYGRWLPDGNIEFLGRMDDQIKMRGYRIELGEIESALQGCHLVSQAVVLVKDIGGNKQLVGYIVPSGMFDLESIILELKSRLPEYMIPTLWIELEQLPLTSSGKVDKKALPEANGEKFLTSKFEAPQNELEEKLVEIWKKLLQIDKVGIRDNFFELGGHSLLAMRLIYVIRRELGVEVNLIDIFQCSIQTIALKIKSQYKPKIRNSDLYTDELSEIALRLESEVLEWTSGESKYMIPIKKDGTKIPFFGVISFNSFSLLSKYIQEDQPLYYLPPTQSAGVEEIALHYVKEIKNVQPSGPYCIGGFCAGGMIALEIAQQLEAQGDEVLSLVLFEFYSPHALLSKKSLKYKKRKLSYYMDRLMSLHEASPTRKDLVQNLLNKSYYKFRKSFTKRPPPKFLISKDYRNYKYKPYNGKVVLFQASIPPLEVNNSPLMGWKDYFTGDVNVIKVDGGHLGILRKPAVEKLAKEFNKLLNDINNK